MGNLSENEVVDCLRDNFRQGVTLCEALARLPAKGPSYRKLRTCLSLIEGSARQLGYMRQDARWLQIGLFAEHCHQRAGRWLRGIQSEDGSKRPLAQGELHPMFLRLADIMRTGHVSAERLRSARTDRVGLILPKAPVIHRDTRPVQVLLPSGMA